MGTLHRGLYIADLCVTSSQRIASHRQRAQTEIFTSCVTWEEQTQMFISCMTCLGPSLSHAPSPSLLGPGGGGGGDSKERLPVSILCLPGTLNLTARERAGKREQASVLRSLFLPPDLRKSLHCPSV